VPVTGTRNAGNMTVRRIRRSALLAFGLLVSMLAACGGSGSDPLANPPTVTNTVAGQGQRLSYAYFQYCVNPIFDAKLPIVLSGEGVVNTCSNASCHNNVTGHGGAFRVSPTAQAVSLAQSTSAIEAADIYKNFLSAQGETIIGAPDQSLILNKPLVRNVLHGGGLVLSGLPDQYITSQFIADKDPIKLLEYWISNPMPAGEDEFSPAGYTLFTPALDPSNPNNGSKCNSN